MDREEQIQGIGKKIQFQINKLKKLNCLIDMSHNTIGIFDDNIKPTISHYVAGIAMEDYTDVIVFSFNTGRITK